MTLVVREEKGSWESSQQVELAPIPHEFLIAGGLTATFDGLFSPGFFVEGGWRPPILSRRLAAVLTFSMRQASFDVDSSAEQALPRQSARVQLFPLAVGACMQIVRIVDLKIYGRGALALVPYSLLLRVDGYPDTTLRGVGYGARFAGGAEWYGIFAELGLAFQSVGRARQSGPSWETGLSVGYRWGFW
jgi:hypothetical protein